MSQQYYRGIQDVKRGQSPQEGGDAYLRGYADEHSRSTSDAASLAAIWERIRVCIVVDRMLPPTSQLELMQAALPVHSEDALVACSACGGETFVVELTRCRGCDNEFYTRDQSLVASRAARTTVDGPYTPRLTPALKPVPPLRRPGAGLYDAGGG